jgi:hypothetical protein
VSLWNGHSPISSLPLRVSLTPRASASRWIEISRFNRSPFSLLIFSIAGSNTGAEREVSQGRAFLARSSERSAEP